MVSRRHPSGSHSNSGSRRRSDASSRTTSTSTSGGFRTPSTNSSTRSGQPLSTSPQYGSTTGGYRGPSTHSSPYAGQAMLTSPSNPLANFEQEPFPSQTHVLVSGDAFAPNPQQALEPSQWGQGQGADARTGPGQAWYSTSSPEAMDHGSNGSGSSDDMAASLYVAPPTSPPG